MIQKIDQEQIEAAIVSLNAEKAFDSVYWSFLYKTLHKFQFHATFIHIIKAPYYKPTAKIKVNGSLSLSIELECGCQQMCPISPFQFGLFIEPLSQLIRQNDEVKGVLLAGEHKTVIFSNVYIVYITRQLAPSFITNT